MSAVELTGYAFSRMEGQSKALADHINLADCFMHAAGAFPVFGEKCRRIRHDFDHLTGFMGVGAATEQEMAELIAGDMAVPEAGCANPDA